MLSRMFSGSSKSNSKPEKKILTQETTDDTQKSIISGEFVLPAAEYSDFWRTIRSDRSTCARFIARIVTLLINFEKDTAKQEKALMISQYGSEGYFITLLLNTLQFLDMFVGFDPLDTAFLNSMEKYELTKKATPNFRIKRIDDGISELSRRRGNRALAAVKMLVNCSTLESPEEFLGLKSQVGNFFDVKLDNTIVEFPFTFTGLCKMSRADYSPKIFDEVLKQLQGAGSALSSMANMQGRTLALMFMLREFLTISPTADQNFMQRACNVLIGLYRWPRPYGVIAQDLLNFISVERRSPGCHLRDRIISEHPVYHPFTSSTDVSTSRRWGHVESTVHAFIDVSQPLCLTHSNCFKSDSRKRIGSITGPSEPPMDMRRAMLSHIIQLEFKTNSSRGTPFDPLGLRMCDETLISQWYSKAMQVCECAKSLPVEVGTVKDLKGVPITIPGGLAKLYRESKLAALIAEIDPTCTFSPRRSESVTLLRQNSATDFPMVTSTDGSVESKPASSDSQSRDVGEVGEPPLNSELAPPLLFGQFAPLAPEVRFEFHDSGERDADDVYGIFPDGKNRYLHSLDYNTYRNALRYMQRAKLVEELQAIFNKVISSSSNNDSVQVELRDSARLSVGARTSLDGGINKITVKLVLMGSNLVLHRFLCALVALSSQRNDIVGAIDLQLFIVPVGQNDIATFLARSDKWYRRHIYDSFKGPLGICPQYQYDAAVADSIVDECGLQECPPVNCLRGLLQDYVRQATQVLPVCVFECLCWAAGGNQPNNGSPSRNSMLIDDRNSFETVNASPDILIPFMLQVEIGLEAQIAYAKNNPKKSSTKNASGAISLAEFLLTQADQLGPIELNVSYILSSMSSSENVDTRRNEAPICRVDSFATLSMSNLPLSRSSREDISVQTSGDNEQYAPPNAPNLNFLVMHSQQCKGNIAAALAARRRNITAAESFLDALRDPESFDTPQHIGGVAIDVVYPDDSFHMVVDGSVYGPFKRVVIRSCQVGVENSMSKQIMTVPIMTHMPLNMDYQ